MSEFLKRGEGKHKGDIKKYDFFSHYRKNAKYSKIERKEYDRFFTEVFRTFSEMIVEEAFELKLIGLGRIRIQARKLNFFKSNGEKAKSLKVNWQKTWQYWHEKYPDLSKDQIVAIDKKPLIYFENEHSQGEFYMHHWDNLTSPIRFKSFYKFKPSRKYSRLIAKIVKQKDRKVFYYG